MKSKIIISVLIFLCTITLGVLAYVAVGVQSIAGTYKAELIEEKVNSSSTFKAVYFEGGSGTTTRTTFRVSLLKPNSKLKKKDKGNILICENRISMNWHNDTLVLRYYCPNDGIFKKETNYKGVIIRHHNSCNF